MKRSLLALWLLFGGAAVSAAQAPVSGEPPMEESAELPTFEAKTEGMRHLPGLLDVYLDDDEGTAWLALPISDGQEPFRCLYVEGLATGLGSNPVGLDRGQLGATRVVEFRRFGKRVLLVEPNLDFRARTGNADEVRATADSFATSVLWAGEVASFDADGVVLVEVTSLLVADAHGSAKAMQAAGQGTWALDAERSVLDPAATLAFPDNLEFEALLTFTSDKPGPEVRSTTPSAGAVSLVQHHSLVRLPDANFTPRPYDLRLGHFGQSFYDFAAPLAEPLEVRFAVRHRLQHSDPNDPASPAVEPIVYYVDRGAPEPVRSALMEGAGWWADAFAAAGFPGAFRVELLPAGVHPLDVRYNVIQWVHRETRGWSYGGGARDPRTGEMIKGHVTLGSQRVRQDRLLFEGLLGVDGEFEAHGITPLELSLARLRQLAAHEVGHTLGLAHNFSASTKGRNSVMDYPAAELYFNSSNRLFADRAYSVGIGAWDKLAIRYLYTEFAPAADVPAALAAIAAESLSDSYRYHSDSDARAPGAAVPYASLWDTGADPVAAMSRARGCRRAALANFGERNLAEGRPRAALADVLAPVYLHHRYQLEATIKMLGGLDYQHGVRGDAARALSRIPAETQRRALVEVLRALEPGFLDLSDETLALLVPYPPGDRGSVERFASRTAPLFDLMSAAETATRLVVDGLLQRERCARLVEQHLMDEELPGLDEVLEQLSAAVLPEQPAATPRETELVFVTQRVVVDGLMRLATDPFAAPAVRELAEWRLRWLAKVEFAQRYTSAPAHFGNLTARIDRFLDRSQATGREPLTTPAPPPGSPIGMDCDF